MKNNTSLTMVFDVDQAGILGGRPDGAKVQIIQIILGQEQQLQ